MAVLVAALAVPVGGLALALLQLLAYRLRRRQAPFFGLLLLRGMIAALFVGLGAGGLLNGLAR